MELLENHVTLEREPTISWRPPSLSELTPIIFAMKLMYVKTGPVFIFVLLRRWIKSEEFELGTGLDLALISLIILGRWAPLLFFKLFFTT